MRLQVFENYEEVSKAAAKIVASQIIVKPDCVLGLATGSTPVGMYRELCRMYRDGLLDFSAVTTFNLDEYYPIDRDNAQSYHTFMWENLFSHINVRKDAVHIPDGSALDAQTECDSYERVVTEKGVDLQILGIGQNGHIGFNEPDESLEVKTHVTALTDNTVHANSRFFESEEAVPKKALTMGIGTILAAKKIVLLACGKNKHDAIVGLLNGRVTTALPASFLNLHNDVIVICDKEAYEG